MAKKCSRPEGCIPHDRLSSHLYDSYRVLITDECDGVCHRTVWYVECESAECAMEIAQQEYIDAAESADEPFGELSFVVEVL